MIRIFSILFLCIALPAQAAESLWLEDMTWQEIANAIKSGKTTALIPTGGTEQNGLHIVLGKHNAILRYTMPVIAEKLGNALIAPIMEYVPEGDITPPTGHMQFAGTLSLRPETFAAVLEDTARSLKQHGFKTICFIGEHGASQAVQEQVANKLTREWQTEGVKVLHISDYYNEHNGQVAFAETLHIPDIEAHAGFADTAEMLVAQPTGIREKLRGHYTPEDYSTKGAMGDSTQATTEYGKILLDLKINAAVKQVKEEMVK